MLPEAHITHHAGARLRLRIPARKGNAAYFARIERALATCDGVAYAEANPLTASVLLHYHGELADLANVAAAGELFALALQDIPMDTVLDVMTDRLDRIERHIRHASNGAVDLDTLLFVGLIGAGIVQIARGQALGPASTLLANAAAILALHRARRAER
jgi:hypothetical protein